MAKSSPSNSTFSRYTRATATPRQRIIGASWGESGTGKTSFWLGAPGPIVVQTLDQGLEGVVEPFTASKDIHIAEYDLGQTPGATFTHALAVDARDKFVADFEHAIQHARTIIWDRESDMFPLFSYAEFGTPDAFGAATGKDWDKMKGGIRRLIAMAKACDVNFGIIQGVKNEWVSKVNHKTGNKMSSPSGARVRAGMDDIEALVHINVEHVRQAGQFTLRVGKARGPGGADIQDQELPGMDFKSFASLVFPQSRESDWV